MLKTLDIINFENHKESHFDFVPGLNAITGTSDQGKSAAIHALHWLNSNRPSGEEFKNWDAKKNESVIVQVTTDNGYTIALERSGSSNKYLLLFGDNELPLRAIKQDVPEEIQKALNISEDSFQGQHDPFFLLQNYSPGDVAKKINSITGLGVIDTIYTNSAKKIRAVNQEIENLKNLRNDYESRLTKFEGLDKVEKLIKTIDKKEAENAVTVSKIKSLTEIKQILEDINLKRKTVAPLIELEETVIKISTLIDKQGCIDLKLRTVNKNKDILEEIRVKKEKVCKLIKAEESMNILLDKVKILETVGKKLSSLKGIKGSLQEIVNTREDCNCWLEPESDVNTILELVNKSSLLWDNITYLQAHKKSLTNISLNKQTQEGIIISKKKEYKEILEKAMICPTCFTPINTHTLNHVMEEI